MLALGLVTNITERKRIDSELARMNADQGQVIGPSHGVNPWFVCIRVIRGCTWYPHLAMDSEVKKGKPPIYLLDSMAFIFRAYHAMQRQRPMSTRTGIPTAATYVFVNMINKLRKDFADWKWETGLPRDVQAS